MEEFSREHYDVLMSFKEWASGIYGSAPCSTSLTQLSRSISSDFDRFRQVFHSFLELFLDVFN